jgi:hypothetical protein
MAGYGTYRVGQAAQVYLERGCTWGPLGANTVIRDILDRVEPETILGRLRQELERELVADDASGNWTAEEISVEKTTNLY